MPRILLQSVGTGGQSNPVWEALAFSVRDRAPDVLLQFCSRKTHDETLPKFDAALDGTPRPPGGAHICADEEDVQTLTIEYCAEIDRLAREYPGALFEADYTSGTKAMSAALVAACISRGVSRLHYATGPRDANGRVTRTDRLVSLDAAGIAAEYELAELGRLFDFGQFYSVSSLASKLSDRLSDGRQRARAATLAAVAAAYEAWDRFDWRQASDLLKRAIGTPDLGAVGWDVRRLERQVRFLNICVNRPHDPARLLDVLLNAERCVETGHFDDAACRLYRLVELIGQHRLRARFKIADTSKAAIDSLSAIAPQAAEKLRARSRDGATVELGLRYNLVVLAEAKDPVGVELWSRYEEAGGRPGPLQQALDARNRSFLAHGDSPISRSDAECLQTSAAAAIDLAYAEFRDAIGESEGDAALRLELATPMRLREVVQFVKCPWPG